MSDYLESFSSVKLIDEFNWVDFEKFFYSRRENKNNTNQIIGQEALKVYLRENNYSCTDNGHVINKDTEESYSFEEVYAHFLDKTLRWNEQLSTSNKASMAIRALLKNRPKK